MEALLDSLRSLQTSRKYSDLKIFCEDEVFRVHKAIICPRSHYFATSCKWSKDGTTKDEITLVEDDPRLVQLMIDYFYQLDYDDSPPVIRRLSLGSVEPVQVEDLGHHGNINGYGEKAMEPMPEPLPEPEPEPTPQVEFVSEEPATMDDDLWYIGPAATQKKGKKKKVRKVIEEPPPQLHLKDDGSKVETHKLTTNVLMYALADKYDIPELKALAQTKFETVAAEEWECIAFAHAAELVFNTTPSNDTGLRDIVSRTLSQHRTLMYYEEIQSLLDSGNGMAWAVLRVVLQLRDVISNFDFLRLKRGILPP